MTLVDARTGIVRRVVSTAMPTDLPTTLCLAEAYIADTTSWSPWPSDLTCAGGVFWDRSAAEAAALGEAVERYCGNLVRPALRVASYLQLRSSGQMAIDPSSLALYSNQQYSLPKFPFVPFTRDLEVRWVQGRDLQTGMSIQVPASLVWLSYFRGEPTLEESRTNAVIYAGIAAGPTRDAAEWSALLELLERDAVTLLWVSGDPIAEVLVPRWLSNLACGQYASFNTRFFCFPSVVGLPVIGALTVHEPTGYISLGTACRPDPAAAAIKALAEAFQLQIAVRQLDDPTSSICRIASTPESPLKPWRHDRLYHLAYRRDYRDVTDLSCNLQLHLDMTLRAGLERRLHTGGQVRLADLTPSNESTDAIVARLSNLGLAVASVDLTTRDVRALGMCVVRLVGQGLYSNAPAAFPFLGGTRLAESLARTCAAPRTDPLPFA